MNVTTDIPCGNGRVHWLSPDAFEVELIAYSKNPRYTFFEIDDICEARRQSVRLAPDRHYDGPGLAKLEAGKTEIWMRRLPDEQWRVVPRAEVRFSPDSIVFDVDLQPGDRVQISTEPPRPYAQTTEELVAIAQDHHPHTRLHVLGASIEQRPIFLLRVGQDVAKDREDQARNTPVVLLVSGEHATEFAGEEITRGMLQSALADDEAGRALRQRYVMDFILNANPDGNVHGWHQYNASDWAQHSYTDGVDRSWHHEFEPYLKDQTITCSPETRAIGDWILKTQPSFMHLAHSWEGNAGNMGVFRVDPESVNPALGATLQLMDRQASEAAAKLGLAFDYKAYGAHSCKHLDAHMVIDRGIPACATEAHPRFERRTLQAFGRELLKAWLLESGVELGNAPQHAARLR